MHVFQIAKTYKPEMENGTGLFHHQVPLVGVLSQCDGNAWQNTVMSPISWIINLPFLMLISLV